MAHDVFISYSAKNKTTADVVCAMLESNGIRCWIAPRDVVPSMEWGECIIEAIEQSRIMVLVFTAAANNSPQIRREVERAVNHGVAILPLRIEDVMPGRALEYFIGNVHWLDALTPPLETHLKDLAGTIKMLLARMEPQTAASVQLAAVAHAESEVSEPAIPLEVGLNSPFIGFIVFTLGLLAVSTYQALFVAPTEQTMGEVQRIFYYHVPSAWTAGVCFFVNFLASVVYLWKRNLASDAVAAASAEVGVTFCTIVLITGPIWARPVWGIWWTWDARLTTTLVLWLIYVSYLVLRRFSAGGQTQVLAAALAIFGFVDVPIVYMSIRWFRTQHPSPVMGGGENSGLDPAMLHAFFWNLAAFTCVGIVLMVVRYRLQMLEEKVEATHAAAALQGGPR